MYKDFIIFIIGIFVIIKSADLFTAGADGIARAFEIPRVVIGVTIVSLATTMPEFTVSTISSYIGAGGMAVGNALGSCLANIGLILGLSAVISPIRFNPKIFKEEFPFLIAVSFILFLLMLDRGVGRGDGVFLVFLLGVFFSYIIVREFKQKKDEKTNGLLDYNIKKDLLKFVIGAVGVVVSARYAIVPSAINIAHFLGLPEVVIGLTMVALGTSLPELFTAIVASLKKMGDLALGNVIGANVLNILWVLGFSAWLRPLKVDIETIKVTMPIVIIITLVMFLFCRTSLRLTRNEGLVLFAIYAGYIFYIFKFAYS